MLQLDVGFLKPFVDGTLKTLKDQCQLEATPLPPFLKGTKEQVPFDIVGIIGITSATFKGSISLCFTKPVFLMLMSNMLNEAHHEITRDLEDGAAELLNIIFGDAKITLNESGHEIAMAIPTVVKGHNVSSGYFTKGGAVVVLPFKTKAGELYIEFLTIEVDVSRESQAKLVSAPAKKRIDAMIFQPFVSETIQTLKNMCKYDAIPARPYYKHEQPTSKYFDIAGVVGITGKHINGSFTLCFQKSVFLKIIGNMLGEQFTELTKDIEDGAAELVNIIFGQAKKALNEGGHDIQMAIPTILKGASVSTNYFCKSPVMVLPFRGQEGEFWIEFTYE